MTLPGRVTQILRSATATTVDATTSRIKDFLKDLPTTAWILVTGTMVGIATAVVYLTGILVERHPEPTTFALWLAFVAGWIGFSVRQFRVKRETHIAGGPQDAPPKEAS